MDAQIKRDRVSNDLNIADILYEAIFGRRQENVEPAVKRKVRQKKEKDITMQIPDNPAACYELGWRRDA